ncbi:hypothetical protein [Streptomyces resistomycificus]|nr:hypothetical protein [Streptomyces resistomycificus]
MEVPWIEQQGLADGGPDLDSNGSYGRSSCWQANRQASTAGQ